MAQSPAPEGSLRQRNVGKKSASRSNTPVEPEVDKLVKAASQKKKDDTELNHKLALSFVTVAAFVTRFWGISHPNEVVFDEVHFGKVRYGAIGTLTVLQELPANHQRL